MIFNRFHLILPVLALFFLVWNETADAQEKHLTVTDGINVNSTEISDKLPSRAFLRSLVLPGWGHFYAGESHRARGYMHTGSDLALLGAIFGFNIKANRIEDDFITFVNLNAGVDISSRSRSFRLAVSNFNSLEDHNDYQLRSRNWNRLIDDTPENSWNWSDASDRNRYSDLRSEADKIRSQLPAIAGLMVINRVISGIGAYNRVRKDQESQSMRLTLVPVRGGSTNLTLGELNGVQAQLKLFFN